jgi:hypothetical protein
MNRTSFLCGIVINFRYQLEMVISLFILNILNTCLVYPMLPLSLDCLFLTAPSVFSNVYLINIYINFANIKTKACWRGLYLISCPVLTSFFQSLYFFLSLTFTNHTYFFLKINYISVFSYCPFSFGHFIACLQFTASDYLFVPVKLI